MATIFNLQVDTAGYNDILVYSEKYPSGQYRVEFAFTETGVRKVNARYNGKVAVIPFWLTEEAPGEYTVYIYNEDGMFDCRPPGTA